LRRPAQSWITLVIGLLMALLAPPRLAAAQAGPGPRAGERLFPAELNLSPQQRERLDAVSARVRETSRELGRRLEERRRELDGLYNRFEMDEARARRLRQEIHEVQGDMLELHHWFQLELRKVLTAEQFTRLQEVRQNRRGPPWRYRRPPGSRGLTVPATGAQKTAPG
jgi:Spy/CpxP family protein refolding chaperone